MADQLQLPGYWRKHEGRRFVVCGLGPSVQGYEPPGDAVVIGVNDIARWLVPDYLLVIDKPAKFAPAKHHRPDSLRHIVETDRPMFCAVHHEAKWADYRGNLVPMPEQAMQSANPPDEWWHRKPPGPKIHSGGPTPVAAMSLAGFMGASWIGIIGVDHHEHPRMDARSLAHWDVQGFGKLARWLEEHHRIEVVNLSPDSALKSLPRTRGSCA